MISAPERISLVPCSPRSCWSRRTRKGRVCYQSPSCVSSSAFTAAAYRCSFLAISKSRSNRWPANERRFADRCWSFSMPAYSALSKNKRVATLRCWSTYFSFSLCSLPAGAARSAKTNKAGWVYRFATIDNSVQLFSADRDGSPQRRTTDGRLDVEPTPDPTQALAHAREADSRYGTAARGFPDHAAHVGTFGHAFAGVLDGQHGALPGVAGLAVQANDCRLAARVACDVAEAFLDDAK